MQYPKQMYKGSYTPAVINAEERTVNDEKEEKAARKNGFIDGHEFFSRPSEQPEVKIALVSK